MVKYPISFAADVQSGAGSAEPWSVSAGRHALSCAIPEEFGGAGGALSPEDFFVLALSNCFVATFKVYASASHLTYSAIDVQAKLTVDKPDSNPAVAKSCHFTINVEGAGQPPRIQTILQKVARSGILLNSVKTENHFEFKINGESV